MRARSLAVARSGYVVIQGKGRAGQGRAARARRATPAPLPVTPSRHLPGRPWTMPHGAPAPRLPARPLLLRTQKLLPGQPPPPARLRPGCPAATATVTATATKGCGGPLPGLRRRRLAAAAGSRAPRAAPGCRPCPPRSPAAPPWQQCAGQQPAAHVHVHVHVCVPPWIPTPALHGNSWLLILPVILPNEQQCARYTSTC